MAIVHHPKRAIHAKIMPRESFFLRGLYSLNDYMTVSMISLVMATSGQALTLGTNEPARALNGGVFNHQCMVINDGIYIVAQNGYVSSARVGDQGDLEPWKYNSNVFPNGMGETYFCAAAYRNYIYALGGSYKNKSTDKYEQSAVVVMARVNAEENVSPWEKTMPLPEPRLGGAAVAAKGYLYYVGGQYHRRVFFAPIQDDGKIGAWKETQRLMSTRYGMQVFAHGDYLYVVGGFVIHQKAVDTVFRAKIKDDGSLDKWRRTEPLPEPRAGYGGALAERDLFLFGGFLTMDTSQTDSGVASTIEADDHFSGWRSLPPLPMEVNSLQAVYVKKWVYVIGGITGQEGGNKVWNTVTRYEVKK